MLGGWSVGSKLFVLAMIVLQIVFGDSLDVMD
jgi:hypothetical protein